MRFLDIVGIQEPCENAYSNFKYWKKLKNKIFEIHKLVLLLNLIPMINSIFTHSELAQWNTLKYTCSNDLTTFKVLLSIVPDNVLNGVVGDTNLLFVACQSHSESVKYLLDCERFTDESINAVNEDGQTAIYVASTFQPNAVKYLLECERFTDTSINKANKYGDTVLHKACVHNSEAVQYLLKSERFTNQSVNATNDKGLTALHWAVGNSLDAVKYLLNCARFTNESINAVSDNGNTILHCACYCATNNEVIGQLLSSNKLAVQTVNAINEDGQTALDIAHTIQNSKIIRRLTDYVKELNNRPMQNHKLNLELANIELQIENAQLKQIIAQWEIEFRLTR